MKKSVRFEEQDLFNYRSESKFDLIVCRNVVIYFTAEAKDKLYAKFCAALNPGGILFVKGARKSYLHLLDLVCKTLEFPFIKNHPDHHELFEWLKQKYVLFGSKFGRP